MRTHHVLVTHHGHSEVKLVSSAEMMGYETEIVIWFLVLEDCNPVVENGSSRLAGRNIGSIVLLFLGLGILAMNDFLKFFKYHVVTMIFFVRGRSESLATMREK
jgi:hypothetical protein